MKWLRAFGGVGAVQACSGLWWLFCCHSCCFCMHVLSFPVFRLEARGNVCFGGLGPMFCFASSCRRRFWIRLFGFMSCIQVKSNENTFALPISSSQNIKFQEVADLTKRRSLEI